MENDPDSLVNDVMSNLMEKEVISGKYLSDLGIDLKEDKKPMDPRTKMKLRQEQVCIFHLLQDITDFLLDIMFFSC